MVTTPPNPLREVEANCAATQENRRPICDQNEGRDKDDRAQRIDGYRPGEVTAPHPGEGAGEPAGRIRPTGQMHKGAGVERQVAWMKQEVQPCVGQPSQGKCQQSCRGNPFQPTSRGDHQRCRVSHRWLRCGVRGSAHSSGQGSVPRSRHLGARTASWAILSGGTGRLQSRRCRAVPSSGSGDHG